MVSITAASILMVPVIPLIMGGSNANTNVSMMGETFKYCAPIAGALGFSAEDTAEAIGLMGNAGIKSTQAGTALRIIMSNLSGEVKISRIAARPASDSCASSIILNAWEPVSQKEPLS